VTIGGSLVCRDLNLTLKSGQCWAMLGVNGVGKTTLLHTLAGLRPPQAGEIRLGGRKNWALQRGVVFQNDDLDALPMTVEEVASTGRYPHLGFWGHERPKDRQAVTDALEMVGIAHLSRRDAASLSGGERQRLRLATFLAQDVPLGLLDEPTNHLDPGAQFSLLNLLVTRTRERHGALLMTLHDVNCAVRFCDQCLLLFGHGNTEIGATSSALTAPTLTRLYRHPMIATPAPWGVAWLPG